MTAGDILDSREAGDKVIRGSALRSAGYIGGILLGLLSTPLMVRHLGVADFGGFVAVSSLAFIANGLTEGGLYAIAVREYAQADEEQRRRLLANLFGLRIVLTSIAALGAVGFALAAGYSAELVRGAILAGLGLIVLGLFGNYTVPLTTSLRLGWLAAIELIRQAIIAVAVVVLVVLGATVEWFLGTALLAAAAALVIGILLTRAEGVRMRFAFDRAEWWALLRDAVPYAAAAAVAVVYFRLGAVLMTVLSTDAEAGYFGLAFRTIEIVSGIPVLMVSSAFPVLSRAASGDDERLRYALGKLADVSLIAGAFVVIAVGLGAQVAVDVIGGPDFDPSVGVLQVLGGAMFGTFFVSTWSYALLTLRRHGALLGANLSALAVGGVLMGVLIPPHGAMGGAIAMLGTELWLAAVYLVLLVRTRPDLRPSPHLLLPVTIASAVAVVPMLVLDVPALPAAVGGTAIYFAVLLVLKAIPAEIMLALKLRRAV